MARKGAAGERWLQLGGEQGGGRVAEKGRGSGRRPGGGALSTGAKLAGCASAQQALLEPLLALPLPLVLHLPLQLLASCLLLNALQSSAHGRCHCKKRTSIRKGSLQKEALSTPLE